jgi:8-oxo-dGTP pyrophosphatase MutT (NUDIX family)
VLDVDSPLLIWRGPEYAFGIAAFWGRARRGYILSTEEHKRALQETGFWGRAAAGCLFLANKTGRILIPHRSEHCQQPNTWGTWGGAVDAGETPIDAVRREVSEEAGYHEPVDLTPLFVFRHESGFEYHNFLAVVPQEFTPNINWETQAFDWFDFGDWPEPSHFGLTALLEDPVSHALLRIAASQR